MSTQDVTQMEAGRELDCEIAERVFGCRVTKDYPATIARIPVCGCGDGNWHGWRRQNVPVFSASIADAWLIVEKLWAKHHADGGEQFSIHWNSYWTDGTERGQWQVRYRPPLNEGDYVARLIDSLTSDVAAPTLPLALCRAALLSCSGSPS